MMTPNILTIFLLTSLVCCCQYLHSNIIIISVKLRSIVI